MVYSIIFNVRTWFNVRPCRFDIYSFGLNAKEDKDGMMESKHLISQLVEDEIKVAKVCMSLSLSTSSGVDLFLMNQ